MVNASDVPLASSLQPNREYDLPPEPHVGRGAAALRVYRSQGPASFVLDRGDVPDMELIAREPKVAPNRLMELPRSRD